MTQDKEKPTGLWVDLKAYDNLKAERDNWKEQYEMLCEEYGSQGQALSHYDKRLKELTHEMHMQVSAVKERDQAIAQADRLAGALEKCHPSYYYFCREVCEEVVDEALAQYQQWKEGR